MTFCYVILQCKQNLKAKIKVNLTQPCFELFQFLDPFCRGLNELKFEIQFLFVIKLLVNAPCLGGADGCFNGPQ